MIEKFIFFDIGANHGQDSIPKAKISNNNIVYAFEPTPYLINFLKKETVGLNNYIIVEKAVSDFNGKSKFNVAGESSSVKSDWGCSSLLDFSEKIDAYWPGRQDFKVTEEIYVDVIRLDKFIEENNIESIHWLHIDAQGSDLNVLKGLGKYIDIVEGGVMEAASKKDILYVNQNLEEDCVKFLEYNNFIVTSITPNDKFNNEVNITFTKKI